MQPRRPHHKLTHYPRLRAVVIAAWHAAGWHASADAPKVQGTPDQHRRSMATAERRSSLGHAFAVLVRSALCCDGIGESMPPRTGIPIYFTQITQIAFDGRR